MNRPRTKQDTEHSLVSYVPKFIIEKALSFHSREIKAFAFIYHDKFTEAELKDDGTEPEPHWHILIRTWQKRSQQTIASWFWYIDDEGRKVNTLVKPPLDPSSAYDYLLHLRDSEKWQYSISDLTVSDDKWFKYDEYIYADNAYLSFRMLLAGESVDKVARCCGRDFLFHIGAIRMAVDLQIEQDSKHPSLLNRQLYKPFVNDINTFLDECKM